jgi:methanogenic corrinoid protein MtbC1
MSHEDKHTQVISAIANLKEELALSLIRERLADKDDPDTLIADCQEGMRQVGERYARQQYYITGLIMGGEIFCEVMELIRPAIENYIVEEVSGKVLLGTVAGDIHDLGKNIVNMLLTCHKFSVYDLGVDVPPAEFLKKAKEFQPDIVGLSGLITYAFSSMRETISLLRQEGCLVPIIIGGGQLDEDVFRYTGADYWVTDAKTGVALCRQLLSERNSV